MESVTLEILQHRNNYGSNWNIIKAEIRLILAELGSTGNTLMLFVKLALDYLLLAMVYRQLYNWAKLYSATDCKRRHRLYALHLLMPDNLLVNKRRNRNRYCY